MTTKSFNLTDLGKLKMDMLSKGITFDQDFMGQFEREGQFVEKRRAYGNSDEIPFKVDVRVPQEILLHEKIVVAVNYRSDSPWKLKKLNDGYYVVNQDYEIPITFPERPVFYNYQLPDGTPVSKIITLYGNATLGLFSPGHCYFWNTGDECKFCSLEPTRNEQADHLMYIKPETAKEAVRYALQRDGHRIKHILLNGGTISDYDLGFKKHLDVLEAIYDLDLPSHVELHLISMPPKDFSLFQRLAKIDATIAMDLEIYNRDLFDEICPGKSKKYGRDRFFEAFRQAVKYMGHGNVYCGFVAGLEPAKTLIEGIYHVSGMGVVPAVNVFHRDPRSQLYQHPSPDYKSLLEIGYHMSKAYKANNFKPFIEETGRNSMDTESFLQCFI